ncbi:conotoxin ArMKLT2-0112 [Drosophila takahashii]|uniref:conotoxin ArMKLT2-0112 n=1 Tax=Drosophila takahashii TaxID=29030 RepID=UPI001CF9221A|nr:conotoxin ArMKLT2-0112-like [Drosophila takahashii]
MKRLITLGLLICILMLGCVADPGVQSNATSISTSTSTSRYCQPSGGYCRFHTDCCLGKCMQVPAECR